jgi:hypothetical protein
MVAPYAEGARAYLNACASVGHAKVDQTPPRRASRRAGQPRSVPCRRPASRGTPAGTRSPRAVGAAASVRFCRPCRPVSGPARPPRRLAPPRTAAWPPAPPLGPARPARTPGNRPARRSQRRGHQLRSGPHRTRWPGPVPCHPAVKVGAGEAGGQQRGHRRARGRARRQQRQRGVRAAAEDDSRHRDDGRRHVRGYQAPADRRQPARVSGFEAVQAASGGMRGNVHRQQPPGRPPAQHRRSYPPEYRCCS